MSPARDKGGAAFAAQVGEQLGNADAGVAGQQVFLPTPADRAAIAATACARATRLAATPAAGAPNRRRGRTPPRQGPSPPRERRAPRRGRRARTARPRFSTGSRAEPHRRPAPRRRRPGSARRSCLEPAAGEVVPLGRGSSASATGDPVRAGGRAGSSASRHHCRRISPMAGSLRDERHAADLGRECRQRQQGRPRRGGASSAAR